MNKIISISSILGLALFVSCTRPTTTPQTTTNTQNTPQGVQAIYPHSDKFKTTKVHGLEYFANSGICKECHGDELDGGGAEVACNSCHGGIFPHTAEFKTTQRHGSEYFKNRTACTQCHGADYAGGDSHISCKQCHSYPHKEKWAVPTHHGIAFEDSQKEENKNDKTKDCLRCHGEENSLKERHPEEFISCGTCHPLMPHSDDFKFGDPSVNHKNIAKTYQGQCTLCHTDLKRLMPEMESCYSCHDEGTIPTVKWEKP